MPRQMPSKVESELCDRCNKDISKSFTVSMFNTETICMACKKIEAAHPLYHAAMKADVEEIRKGNYNFKGIGLPEDLKPKVEFNQKQITDI